MTWNWLDQSIAAYWLNIKRLISLWFSIQMVGYYTPLERYFQALFNGIISALPQYNSTILYSNNSIYIFYVCFSLYQHKYWSYTLYTINIPSLNNISIYCRLYLNGFLYKCDSAIYHWKAIFELYSMVVLFSKSRIIW